MAAGFGSFGGNVADCYSRLLGMASGNACRAFTCVCTSGTAATRVSGTFDGDCCWASCHTSFTLNGCECEAITCPCTSGTEATGVSCTSDGDNVGASCNAGYTLYGNAGQANTGAPARVAPQLLGLLARPLATRPMAILLCKLRRGLLPVGQVRPGQHLHLHW